MEFNAFYDSEEADDPKIQVYQAAVGIGGDLNPSNLFGRQGGFNHAHFTSEENDKLLEAINSDESFDEECRKNAFIEWQHYIIEELPVIPMLYRCSITGANNRVKILILK